MHVWLKWLAVIAMTSLPFAVTAHAADEAAGTDDAAELYQAARMAIRTDSPAASALEYPECPPFGEDWDRMAAASWRDNAAAFPFVRKARGLKRAV
jgi:hypothetical protein